MLLLHSLSVPSFNLQGARKALRAFIDLRVSRLGRSVLALGATVLPGMAFAVDVQISSFTDVPDPAVRGGNITFSIVTANTDGDTAHDVVVTYALPANTQFVSVADAAAPSACSHDGATPGTVTCTYPTLLGTLAAPAGPTRTINVVLRTLGASVATLNSTVNVTTSDADVNPANNSLTQNTTVNDGADLSAVLSGAPDPALGGALVTWTVSGSNLGPNVSGAMTFTSTLPGVLTYVGAGSGGAGWTCGAAGQVVTCTHSAASVGAYPGFPIVTRIIGVASGTVTVNGSISSTVGDPDPTNNTPVASVAVNPGADLSITQDPPSPNPATSASAMSFVLHPGNAGPNAASAGAKVTFPLPAGFAVTSATGSAGWTCASAGTPATVTCTFSASLASGASGTLTINATTPTVATPTAYGPITASIAPNAGGPVDPNSLNNTAPQNVTVAPDGLDLSVTKSKGPPIVALGANMTSTIVVHNAGPRTAASGTITLVDALDPTKEQYVGAAGTNWSCTSAPPNVDCTYNASLAVGDSSTLTITTKALAVGLATNNATSSYSGTPGDFNSANDTVGASVTITAANDSPDLGVGLNVTTTGGVQSTVEANETRITYALALTNQPTASPSPAKNVVVTLSIPGRNASTAVAVSGTVLTNTSGTSNATFTCAGTGTGSSSDLTCTQAAGTVLSPGDVVTFTVTADRAMTEGSYNANASAVSTTQGDPLPSNNSTTRAVVIDPIADVELVSKVLGANPVLAGTNAVYTITARNNGPSPTPTLSLRDVFTIPGGDTGFTFVSATASNGGSCSGLTAGTSYASGTPTLVCDWASSVSVGATRTVTITVRPNWMAGAATRTLDNTATMIPAIAEDSVGGQGAGANSKLATLDINPASVDILINDTDLVDPLGYDPSVASNNDITYNVGTTNNGPSLASGVGFTFKMTPPNGKTVTFRGDGGAAGVAAANPSGTIAGSLCDQVGTPVIGPASLTVTCMFTAPGQIANTASVARYLVFRVSSPPNTGGDVYNTLATAILNETDSNTSNNQEGETTTVRVRADLSIVKTPVPGTVQLRQPFNWTIAVANAGPGDSQTTGLTDTLPSGMSFGTGTPTWAISGGGATGTCSTAGQTLTCAFATLPAGQTATVTVPTVISTYPSGGTLQNCANATTSEVDPQSSNSLSVCATVTVQRSSISGTVFEDRDRAGGNGGTPQATGIDPRVGNVTVQLTGTDAYGNAISRSVQSDPSTGVYTFNDLSPADAAGYLVTEVQPSGYINGPVAPPTHATGTYAGGGTAGNSSYATIALAGNTDLTGYDFPEVRKPSLSGFVYIDVNANQTRDAGTDTALSGATVRLLNATTLAVVATTTTDGTGAYAFTNLDPFSPYTLEEPLPTTPTGLGNGAVNPGKIGGAACASGCTAQADTPAANTDRIASIDLSSGADGTLFNFGEEQITAISGLVFIDTNRDAALAAGETGRLASVTLKLVQGADCASGTTVQTTTTAANGTYQFDNVIAAQSYLVCETQPAGYGTGSAKGVAGSNVIAVPNLPSGGSADNNFGETLASIAGSVYQDNGAGTPANFNNGVRDAGEPGIAGVTVTLSGIDTLGAAVSVSAVTDASGNFVFDGLLASNASGYTVTEGAIPAVAGVFADGKDTAGSLGGSIAVNDTVGAIVLAAGTQATGYVFGELPIAPITGTVYIDRDRNGAMSATPVDGRIPGVTITLYVGTACSGTVFATTTTDAAGNYSISGAPAGQTYTLCETQPVGYANGQANPGTNGTAPSADSISITGLASSGSAGNNFGERVGSISGSVYVDSNNDGIRQGGEAPLAGVSVTLSGADSAGNSVNRTATTDASGNYRFDDLVAANAAGYTVTEQTAQPLAGSVPTVNGRTTPGTIAATPSGTATPIVTLPSAISNIALSAGADSVNDNFGEVLAVAISGRVFLDINNNGIQNLPGDAGLAGVAIVITGTDDNGASVTRNVTTAVDGSYSVSDLRPGTYAVGEPTQPAGTSNGLTVAGSTGGNVTAVGTVPSAITGITLTTPGANSTGNNFAEIANSSAISGRVWFDLNDNGVIDPAETGIAGVTLDLTGVDASGAAVTRTLTSDANGAFTFSGLAPGVYAVREPTQPAGTINGKTLAGTAGGTATAVGTVPSAISAITLTVGQESKDNLFGEIATSPDLVVSKDHALARFTVNNAGSYRIRVRNVGNLATTGTYTVTDRLPIGLTLASTPTGSGWSCVGAAGASTFTCTSDAVIAAGATRAEQIDVAVSVGAQAATHSPVNNVAMVEGGGEIEARRPTQAERDLATGNPEGLPKCDPAILHNVCRDPTVVQLSASLAGTVWYDVGSTPSVLDAGDRRLPGWLVEVVDPANGQVVSQTTSAADGSYKVPDLLPGVPYAVRFLDPQSGVVFGYPVNGEVAPGSSGASCDQAAAIAKGTASSCVAKGTNPQLTVVLAPGENLAQQSLPVDPSGIVYDSGLRQPVPGAVVTLAPSGVCAGWNPGTAIVGASLGGYTINGASISMKVGADGFYQFLFGTTAPATCQFTLSVVPPAGYTFASTLIPAEKGVLIPPGGAGSTYEVQPQAGAPTGAVGTATTYYLTVSSGSAGANIVHNHIPLDAALPSGLSLTKTGDKSIAEVGDSVRYGITVQLTAGALPRQVTVLDRLPAGFTYIKGTASVNNVPIADPAGGPGPQLAFNLGAMPADGKQLLQYRLRVGVGSQQGDGTNRARAYACGVPQGCVTAAFSPLAGSTATNEGQHKVVVSGGVFAPEACLAGKIFVDCNGNQVQDREELGIPGVRLVMQDGTTLVSDSEGKYSYCGLPPRSAILKVDPSTLPRGSRLITSSNRNLGDANSLWLDLKNGELHRGDFIEGSCSNPVLEQVKARRAQGEVRAPESEKKRPALRFESKAHGLTSVTSPQEGTDSANQTVPKPRDTGPPPPPPTRSPPKNDNDIAAPAGGSNAAR